MLYVFLLARFFRIHWPQAIENMVEIEIIGKAIATAIKTSGKYASEEHGQALGTVLLACPPENLKDTIQRMGNLSADRQELEKSGILPMASHKLNALSQQVKAALIADGVAMPIKAS